MYESSTSQFFNIITGIQSGPDAFDESRLVMTILQRSNFSYKVVGSKIAEAEA